MNPLLAKLLLSRLTWYSSATGLATWLVFAPVLGQWSNTLTAWAFGASAPAIAASVWLGQGLDRKGTLMQVNNHLGTQWQIDRMVDDINLGRAQFQATTDQLLGNNQQLPQLIQQLTVGGPQLQLGGAVIPQEDLAQTIATADSDEQNFLFVGKSRSGKTSMLVNAMARKHQHLRGEIDWYVFNGKPEKDNHWGGLVRSPSDYWAVNSDERAVEMIGQFKACVGALTEWQDTGADHYSMFIVADEVNNQRELMGEKDEKQYDSLVRRYATQCMSEASGLWLSSHAYNVEDIGLNRRLQKSFQLVILGRNGKYDSIADAINDYRLISNRETREQLKAQLDIYQGKDAIALTNVGGSWRLVQLPYYSKEVEIVRGALNQPVGEIIDAEPAEDSMMAERLNAVLELPSMTQVPDELQVILQAANQGDGSISARDAQRLKELRNKFNADAVKGLFQQLEDMGWGVVQIDAADARRRIFWLYEAKRTEL